MITDRLLPHEMVVEKALVGSIIRNPDALPAVQGIIRARDFYHDAHQRIFAAIETLANAGNPIDLASVFEELRRAKQIDDVGGHKYLTDLWECEPIGAHAEYHARLVRDCAAARRLIHVATEIARDAYDRIRHADDMFAAATRKIEAAAADSLPADDNLRVAADMLRERVQAIDDRIAGGGEMQGLSTGYMDLDDLLGGMRGGQMIVVGARPSCGKTAFGLNVAVKLLEKGIPTLFFSLEMPHEDMADRLLSMGSGVAFHRMSRAKRITQEEARRLTAVASPAGYGGYAFYLDDNQDQTIGTIGAITRQAIRRHGIQLVVIDYLQLITPDNARDPKHQQVAQCAEGVRRIARRCGVPILCLAQLNRQVENRGPDAEPRLADLRESGVIEQCANSVLLLHPGDMKKDVSETKVLVRKNRNGPKGDVKLVYRAPVLRFENMLPEG